MMMEVINGEQVTFRRMDEILENVTHALELPNASGSERFRPESLLDNVFMLTSVV